MNNFAKRPFTGWHMTTILVSFFGIVIAVNFIMARMAVSTFGGTVVDNSYVASQKYNRWLAAADRQAQLGWNVSTHLSTDRHVVIKASKSGAVLTGLTVEGNAAHPLGQVEDIKLQFVARGDGSLVSSAAIPSGRWNIVLSLRRNADIYRVSEPLR